jgi:hypothetical protein
VFVVVPAKAGSHDHNDLWIARSVFMGPGSRSPRNKSGGLGRDDKRYQLVSVPSSSRATGR